MKRVIVSRQVIAQIIGPDGPVDVGKWQEITVNEELETLEYKPTDGTTEYLVEGFKYAGTLKRGEYDPTLARMIWNLMHPGTDDPPRHILLVVTKYNDGTVVKEMYKEVLITKRGRSIGRGAPVTEDLDWVAEDKEEL